MDLPYYQAEVIYHVRYEMARTVDDILARRTRALFLDASAAIECSKIVANLMAQELNQDKVWIDKQLTEFHQIAKNFMP